jgi:hypothetical protein
MASVPYLIGRSQYDPLVERSELVHGALETVLLRHADDPRVRSYFAHLDAFQWLFDLPKTTTLSIPTARFDLIEDGLGGYGMIETNSACPHGSTTSFEMRDTDLRPRLQAQTLTPIPVQRRQTIFDFLATQYRARFGSNRSPRIGIGHAPAQTGARPDVQAILEGKAESGRLCGYDCEVVAITALRRRNGRLEHEGRPIDVLYQFLDPALDRPLSGFANSKTEIADYLEAIRREELLVVNPLARCS